ncbi:hypothetical protein E2C01_088448 [Portunus trituberculatus]|uniref:Uncharacterized protein n=1 Tax=Portunus trituberculatus TaxID=210409 RepID=A0A5B7JG09_PORTR|nr:hypothetical protein [Portunus trituberculatus]
MQGMRTTFHRTWGVVGYRGNDQAGVQERQACVLCKQADWRSLYRKTGQSIPCRLGYFTSCVYEYLLQEKREIIGARNLVIFSIPSIALYSTPDSSNISSVNDIFQAEASDPG